MAALLEGRTPPTGRRQRAHRGRRPGAARTGARGPPLGPSASRTGRPNRSVGRASDFGFDGDGPARASTRSPRPSGSRAIVRGQPRPGREQDEPRWRSRRLETARASSSWHRRGRERGSTAKELLRQMQNAELEGRQKLWRWLILAAIGVPDRRNLAGRLAAQPTPRFRPERRPWRHEDRTPSCPGTGRREGPDGPGLVSGPLAGCWLAWSRWSAVWPGIGRLSQPGQRSPRRRLLLAWPGHPARLVRVRPSACVMPGPSVRRLDDPRRWPPPGRGSPSRALGTGLLAAVEKDAGPPRARSSPWAFLPDRGDPDRPWTIGSRQ